SSALTSGQRAVVIRSQTHAADNDNLQNTQIVVATRKRHHGSTFTVTDNAGERAAALDDDEGGYTTNFARDDPDRSTVKKRQNTYQQRQQQQQREMNNDLSSSSSSSTESSNTSSFNSSYHHSGTQNSLDKLANSISAQFVSFGKELLSIKKHTKELIYTSVSGDINLSEVRGNTPAEYGREVMRKLFTDEELATKIMPQIKKKNTTNREILDKEKLNVLKEAIICQFKIKPESFARYYETVLLNSFRDLCSNTRSKLRKEGRVI
ncbi:unnamed protein product, partial [Didymodactylos carnosus]